MDGSTSANCIIDTIKSRSTGDGLLVAVRHPPQKCHFNCRVPLRARWLCACLSASVWLCEIKCMNLYFREKQLLIIGTIHKNGRPRARHGPVLCGCQTLSFRLPCLVVASPVNWCIISWHDFPSMKWVEFMVAAPLFGLFNNQPFDIIDFELGITLTAAGGLGWCLLTFGFHRPELIRKSDHV